MKFFADKKRYTHYARFYGVPVYINLESEDSNIEGRNIIFDWLLLLMTYFHNYFVESSTQLLAYIFSFDYEPGFPLWIVGEIK